MGEQQQGHDFWWAMGQVKAGHRVTGAYKGNLGRDEVVWKDAQGRIVASYNPDNHNPTPYTASANEIAATTWRLYEPAPEPAKGHGIEWALRQVLAGRRVTLGDTGVVLMVQSTGGFAEARSVGESLSAPHAWRPRPEDTRSREWRLYES